MQLAAFAIMFPFLLGAQAVMCTPTCVPAQKVIYADVVSGSDGNSGLCQSHQVNGGAISGCAKKTLASAMGSASATGAVIGLPRGTCERWREEITGGAYTYLTISAFGSGAMPLLDASDIITGTDACGIAGTGTWAADTGTTWKSSLSAVADGGFVQFWKNGLAPYAGGGVARATSQANCEATANSYWPSSDSGGAFTLYYNSGSVSNPGSDGNLYEFSNRKTGINDDNHANSHITVVGIRTRRNHSNNGSLDVGQYATLINVAADEGTKHNALCADGCTIKNISMHNAWCPTNGCNGGVGGGDMLVIFDAASVSAGSQIANLTATQDAFDQTISGVYSHTTGGTGLGSVVFDTVSCTNLNTCVNAIFNSLSNITGIGSGGITVYNPTTTQITNASFTSMPSNGQAISMATIGTALTVTNLTAACSVLNLACIRVSAAASLTINGASSCQNAVAGGCIYVDTGVTMPLLSISGMTFQQPDVGGNQIKVFSGNAPTSVSLDNNTYHYNGTSHNGNINWNGTQYNWYLSTDIAAWKALGYDAHSAWVAVTP